MTDELKPHPLAEMVPRMMDYEYAELVEDIRYNNLKDKIVLYEGMILDGRHRAEALAELGIPIDKGKARNFDPEKEGDPADFVISRNIMRRHLNKGQRAAAVINILKFQAPKRGRPTNQVLAPTDVPVGEPTARGSAIGAKENSAISAELISKRSGAGERTVRQVLAVQRENPEAFKQIATGEKSLSQVEKELGTQKKLPTLASLIPKAHASQTGAIWIRFRGVIISIAASTEAQEEFSSAHNWPCVWSEDSK
jgi:hypothetical protein